MATTEPLPNRSDLVTCFQDGGLGEEVRSKINVTDNNNTTISYHGEYSVYGPLAYNPER